MNINIDFTSKTHLCDIMLKYGSDKSRKDKHNYTIIYDYLFQDLKEKNIRILELGIGTNDPNMISSMGLDGKPGASLRGWSEYFTNGLIFGADIDRNILFSTDKIKTFYCDQTNPESIKSMWSNKNLSENLVIIIDDGLHTFLAQLIFLENSFNKLNPGGFYIIEDITIDYFKYIRDYIKYVKFFDKDTFVEIIPHNINKYDNILAIIKK